MRNICGPNVGLTGPPYLVVLEQVYTSKRKFKARQTSISGKTFDYIVINKL